MAARQRAAAGPVTLSYPQYAMKFITVTKFDGIAKEVVNKPKNRAGTFAQRGANYFEWAKTMVAMGGQCDEGLMITVMEQTLEFLVKAIAVKHVEGFDPDKYKDHHFLTKIVRPHKGKVPVFAKLEADKDAKILMEELIDGYDAVRYGEAALGIHLHDLTVTFHGVAEELLGVLKFKPRYRAYRSPVFLAEGTLHIRPPGTKETDDPHSWAFGVWK